eukprot:m.305011 g.305011  ORF g.305011 m.305011 type:complete len:262 (-) comp16446_c0_seq2:191-976(-)
MNYQEEAEFLAAVCYWLLGLFSIAGVILIFIDTPYGRYAESAHWIFGFTIPSRVSWIFQESPTLISLVVCLCYGDQAVWGNFGNIALLLLFTVHYVNRTLIFPFRLKPGGRATISTTLMAFMFCSANGYVQCRTLTYFREYGNGWLLTPNFILGFVMYCSGMYINMQSDNILLSLRDSSKPKTYKIPYGGLFEYVSGANFFGEIIEWTGFAIACSSLPAITFAITTALNIGPRAFSHHRWYKTKFGGEYPQNRKALIPFLW